MDAASRSAAVEEAVDIGLRVVASIFGGYALTYALTAAASVLLHRGGLDRVDSALVSTNLAILIYPAVMIWAFAARRGWFVLAALIAATAGLGLVAWLLPR